MKPQRAITFVSRRRAGRGFTLVELMISLVLGLFLVAAVGGVFISSKRSFWTTNAITTMDDTARTVFGLMGASIRQAGFNGCQNMSGAVNGDTRTVANDLSAGWWTRLGKTGIPEQSYVPVQAYAAPANDPDFAGSDAIPVQNTEVLRLIGTDPGREVMVTGHDPSKAEITTSAHAFQNGQTLLATNCLFNSFFIMTDGKGTANIIHADDGDNNCSVNLAVTACGAGADMETLPEGTSILPVVATAWYVAPSLYVPTPPSPGKGNSLWRASTSTPDRLVPMAPNDELVKNDELVNGVENLAFQFAVDDGSLVRWQSTGSVTDWGQVRAVRVHLLLSTLPDSGVSAVGDNANVIFNGNTLTSSTTPAIDPRRVYREYTAVFTLRNTLINQM